MLERWFRLREQKTTVATEVRAGVATFLTMAYILAVNPQILGAAGMPAADVVAASAIASALAGLAMAFLADYPFALAPGMGINAYFAYSVCLGMGVSWQTALGAVFVEGVLFLVLSLAGSRTAMLEAIPRSIKLATAGGIGLFLALLGLQHAGVVVRDEATLVGLGNLAAPPTLLSLAGTLLIAALLAKRIPGGILVGVGGVAAVAWLAGLAPAPSGLVTAPRLPTETFLAFDLVGLLDLALVPVVLAFLFVDVLDTAGTLVGVGQLGGFTDRDGNLPRADRAFAADAIGTIVGAALGTSTVTTYIESATGIEEGGRTGLTTLVTSGLFLLALVFTPLFVAIPPIATAPALIVVGAMMMRPLRELDWSAMDEALPAFLTLAGMPFTFSIANGLSLGILAHVAIRVLTGRWREVSPLLAVIAVALVAFFVVARSG